MAFEGTYELTKSENFNEYMKAVGVGIVMRNMAAAATPKATIAKEGDEWTYKTSTTFKTTEIKFKLGEEFKEETADGRKCLSTITQEGDNKWKHVQKINDQELVMYREFTDAEMKMTLEAPGVVCTRLYKRL
jgi:hypothetical protein